MTGQWLVSLSLNVPHLCKLGRVHTWLIFSEKSNNMLTCAGTSIPAMMYRQVLEQTEATSLPPQGKLEVTLGFIHFLHPLMVLKNWNGNDWCSDNPNAPLNIAVISFLSWSSDHSVENEFFPTKPAWANLVRFSPLGIMKTDDSGENGKHTTSFVYVLTFLWFKYPERAPLRWGNDGRETYWKQGEQSIMTGLLQSEAIKNCMQASRLTISVVEVLYSCYFAMHRM